ncbi:MAG: T9SS type A sorting domain-containing protein [Bacteroidia bacterium]|nr:T9SS type A sorting domain-containing protein [Bacteroidia bacterium]
MRTLISITVLLLIAAMQAGAQGWRGVQLELTVANGQGRSQVLAVGVYEGASSALDMHMGEGELPPQPPNEVFDARCISTPGASQLGAGSLTDYRPPTPGNNLFSVKYTIAYQAGINASGVTMSWFTPLPGRITKLKIDDADMSGKTEIVSQFATGQFTVELSVDMSPLGFVAIPDQLTFNVNNRDPLPSINLTIRPVGDPSIPWILSPDMTWLDFGQMSGEGELVIPVAVNTRLLPAGTYSGNIRVSTMNYPVYLDIPVNMVMVVGTGETPRPLDLRLEQNYPNPFSATTSIAFTLPRSMHATILVLDALGRTVRTFEADYPSGSQLLHVDAAELPPGFYEYRLIAGGVVLTKQMLLLR